MLRITFAVMVNAYADRTNRIIIFFLGKTSSVTSNNSINNESSRDVVSNSAHRNHMNVNGGCPPGLGSLFTHGIPKLKPTGLSIGKM